MDIQRSRRLLMSAVVLAWALLAGTEAIRAQAPRIRYVSGQNIQPVYEGWEPRKDGSYDLWFSYLNRNLGEDLIVPVGRENSMDPGGPDRGQPTYFYAGRREFVFKVNVPKDFGKSELIWALNVRGDALKAVGSLIPVWEINTQLMVSRTIPGARLDTLDQNHPPTLALDPITAVSLSGGATLRAVVTDDGVPGPRPSRPQRAGGTPPPFLNAPLPAAPPGPPQGLSLAWMEYRGPAKVIFDPAGFSPVKSGEKAVATARFTEPGTYELRAVAHDSILETTQNVTVTVK